MKLLGLPMKFPSSHTIPTIGCLDPIEITIIARYCNPHEIPTKSPRKHLTCLQALLHRLLSPVARQHRGALLPCGAVHGHAVESAVRQETWDGTSGSWSSSKNRLGPLSSSKKPPAFAMENMGQSPFWIGESYRNWRFLYGYVKLPEATHHQEGGFMWVQPSRKCGYSEMMFEWRV